MNHYEYYAKKILVQLDEELMRRMIAYTTQVASQTDLAGEQCNDSRVGALVK